MTNSFKEIAKRNRDQQAVVSNRLLLIMLLLQTASIAGLFSILTLVFEHVFGLDRLKAVQLFTTFAGLNYSASLAGGFISKRMGYRKTVYLGLLVALLGLIGFYVSSYASEHPEWLLLSYLSALILGNGLISPCLIALFGDNAKKRTSIAGRFHASFVLNYMGMNLGAILGIFLAFFCRKFGDYQLNFLWSAVIYLIILILFRIVVRKMHLTRGLQDSYTPRGQFLIAFCGALCFITVMALLKFSMAPQLLMVVLTLGAGGYLLYAVRDRPNNASHRMKAFLMLTAVTVLFFIPYALEPDLFPVFIESFVSMNFFGLNLMPNVYFIFNPSFNFLVGALLFGILFWTKRSFAPITWFSIALGLTGLGFLVLWGEASFSNGMVSSGEMIFIYLILSFAEMALAPVAFEIIFLFGEEDLYGGMSGVTQLAIGLGALTASPLTKYWVPSNHLSSENAFQFFLNGFKSIGIIWLILGGIVWFLSRWVRRFRQP